MSPKKACGCPPDEQRARRVERSGKASVVRMVRSRGVMRASRPPERARSLACGPVSGVEKGGG
eukprot:scaffold220059_cov30-Tisochrysis_lutea.AAC.2